MSNNKNWKKPLPKEDLLSVIKAANTPEDLFRNADLLGGLYTEDDSLKEIVDESEYDRSEYIYLPNRKILVAKETSLHGKNWYDAHEEAHKQKARMLNLREFADFLLLLKSGKAEDELGNKILKSELKEIYKKITEVRNIYRGEWLDAQFEDKNGTMYINYNHRTKSKKLEPLNSESLESCLMNDQTPGIDLEDWLSRANKQGLPVISTKKGDLYYWHPRENAVAGFCAGADRANLDCVGDPSGCSGGLGVRLVREK